MRTAILIMITLGSIGVASAHSAHHRHHTQTYVERDCNCAGSSYERGYWSTLDGSRSWEGSVDSFADRYGENGGTTYYGN